MTVSRLIFNLDTCLDKTGLENDSALLDFLFCKKKKKEEKIKKIVLLNKERGTKEFAI